MPSVSIATVMTIPNHKCDGDAVSGDRAGHALYRLLVWLSPGFPVGAFSYSHGLEAAVERGDVRDRASLLGWVRAVIRHGGGRIDAAILCQAYRAAAAADLAALAAVNGRGLAYRGSAELALEASAQGEAFRATCLAAWPDAFLAGWAHPPGRFPFLRASGAGPGAGGIGSAGVLSCGRRGGGRARRDRPRGDADRSSAGDGRKPDRGRIADRHHRPNRRPAHPGGPRTGRDRRGARGNRW